MKHINNMDAKQIEIDHLKGKLEAIKHYYAVLIAKNVEKVEGATKTLESLYDEYDEDEELVTNAKRAERYLSRCKSSAQRKLIKGLLEDLDSAKASINDIRISGRGVVQQLRQVL